MKTTTSSPFHLLFGFDFLEWNFRLLRNNEFISIPSSSNYKKFVKRVKVILNNSNYGSFVKVNKVFPIIKEWKSFHRFCLLDSSRYSLFYLKKRAFKIFNKESKQDFYSSKRLLDKCFKVLTGDESFLNSGFNDDLRKIYFTHVVFEADLYVFKFRSYCCIHCGMSLITEI